MLALLATSSTAWSIQPAVDPSHVRAAAAVCIDEFETLAMPLLAFPGWQNKAREAAITKWTESRKALLSGDEPHVLLVAVRNEEEQGRYFEGIDDSLLGFAELKPLPASRRAPLPRDYVKWLEGK